MAKDPAFLFYPGDWLGGTIHLNFECKGAYFDLLMLQFNRGHITLDMAKHMLGDKFPTIWPQIQDKFETDGKVFWNKRLRIEKEKRNNYAQSRRNNLKGTSDIKPDMSNDIKTDIKPLMGNHKENRNINRNKDRIKEGLQGEILPFQSEEFKAAWNKWLTYRTEIKKPYKSIASIEGTLKKLGVHHEAIAIKMIEDSISNQWQGLFEPKTNGKQQTTKEFDFNSRAAYLGERLRGK